MNPKRQVLEALSQASRVLIAMHAAPDGDSAGSGLALGLALKRMGREVAWVARDPIPERLGFLPESQTPIRWDEALKSSYDWVVAVDCGSRGRLGAPEEFWQQGLPLINIDHHSQNSQFGTINWVEGDKSSTGEMMAELFWEAGWQATAEEAVCLYTAISTDTLSFRQINTQKSTLKVAHWLAEAGLDLGDINQRIWDNRSHDELRFVGWALMATEVSPDGRFAWLGVTREIMERFQVDDSGVDTIVHHLMSIASVEVAVLAKEALPSGHVKVSWRGKRPWNVANLASQFGGGGHAYAAAAQVTGTLPEVLQSVLQRLEIEAHG